MCLVGDGVGAGKSGGRLAAVVVVLRACIADSGYLAMLYQGNDAVTCYDFLMF